MSWGWKGIEVWNFCLSLGIPAMLRAVFNSSFSTWVWYDQLLFFVGAFLIILGVLIFVFTRQKLEKSKPKDEAIRRLLIRGNEKPSLTIFRGNPGHPVAYPIRVINIERVVLELVQYKVTVYLNDNPVLTVEWDNTTKQTSNGVDVECPIYLQPDTSRNLNIFVIVSQLPQQLRPDATPFWGAKGELFLQGDSKVIRRDFDFINDQYVLPQNEWDELRFYGT